MRKTITLTLLALMSLLPAYAQKAQQQKVVESQLTVLERIEKPGGHAIEIVSDARGRVWKRTVRPHSMQPVNSVAKPTHNAADNTQTTFYEGFEGYITDFGMNWIPQGWSKINTPAHTPTEEQLSHNINNSWYVYYSSDMYQEKTTDGLCEAFIHFGYNGNYGATDAAQDEWLVSPSITLGNDETLSFMLQCDYSTVYTWDWNAMKFEDRSVVDNTMKVMVSTDDGATWQCAWDLEADEVRNVSDDDCYDIYGWMMYHHFSTSLAAYAGKTVKIAFRYERRAGFTGNSMMVDAVTIKKPQSEWQLLGTGTMADGWVVPQLTKNPGEVYNPQDYKFNVEIYESTATPGKFKIASPYTSSEFPFINLNGNKTTPYDIVIDATNPAFVRVEPQISGFEHNDPGSKAQRYAVPYYISHAGQYYLDEGNSIEDITECGYASTYDATTRTITITYPQYGHEKNGSLDMGYSCSTDDTHSTVITLPAAEPQPEWESRGLAIFEDGIIYPGYYNNPKGNGWTVEIEERNDRPGMYRLKNPYTTANCPLYEYNHDTNGAYVIIDATDPEIVVFMPQYSGYNATIGSSAMNFYIGNLVGSYIADGSNIAELKQYLSADKKDIVRPDGVIEIRNGLFGSNNTTDFGYLWTNAADMQIKFPTRIFLPGCSATPETPDIEAETITLNKTSLTDFEGTQYQLTATVLPVNTTDQHIYWKSKNPTIAKVSDTGMVSMIAPGEATIVAVCGLASATCAITVLEDNGVNDVDADMPGSVHYYNLQGVELTAKPVSGVYFKVKNGKVSKVFIK